jgi:hypothetical protein
MITDQINNRQEEGNIVQTLFYYYRITNGVTEDFINITQITKNPKKIQETKNKEHKKHQA